MFELGNMFQVDQHVVGPLTSTDYFSPRMIAGLRPCLRLGMGTAGVGGMHGPADFEEAIRVLHDAWSNGYLLVDTSPHYAKADAVLGQALQQWKGDPPVICTKLEGYPRFMPPEYAKSWRESLVKQFEESLQHLGGRQIDGLAMHDAETAPPGFQVECHQFLADLITRGEIGAAGLGGGGPALQLRYLDTGQYRYAITYMRLTALSIQALCDIVPACRRIQAGVIVGSPIHMGFLGDQFEHYLSNPPQHVPPAFVSRAKLLKRLADDAGMRLTHLALRFAWSVPYADFVLTGSSNLAAWRDTKAAFENGPLPADLYRRVWQIAQHGMEPINGG